jgi:DNA ligase (NAD+)
MNKIIKIKKLTEELLQYCHEYYVLDAPTISDIEYDKKFDTLKQLEDETNFWLANSPTRKVQGEVLPYLEKVRHSVPMLSAHKSTNINDVKQFINNRVVVASYKLDGASLVVKFLNGKLIQGLSRGSGTDGENITHTVKMIKNLPMTIPYKGYLEIRGEALIPWGFFYEMNVDGSLGHPRNIASGGLRQLNADEAAKRNIYFYAFTLVNWKDVGVKTKQESLEFLSNNGFDVVPNILIPSVSAISVEEALWSLDRKLYENPTDGWCFEYNDLEYGESLGSTEYYDRRMFALKPAVEGYDTYFRGIEYNTCRTGIVSMTALFDPVEIGNTMVSRATLHNCDFFNGLELGEGDLITVTKFNEIIPGIMNNQTCSGTYKLIDKCPSCGESLIIKNTGTANVLYCPNENCPSRELAQFVHFVSKGAMDIRGLSEATLEKFISLDYINDFKSIYHLSDYYDKLVQLDGFGTKSIQKLLMAIEKSRDVKLENFIAALGIPNIGLSAAKTISKHFNGNYKDFINAYFYWNFDWTTLEDFGQVMAESMNKYLEHNLHEINELAEEFNFILPAKVEIRDNPFSGKLICVTGKLNNFTRNSINEKIAKLGAKAVSSVSSKTDYLITNEQSGSSKYKKAVELNIPIISEDEFLKMIGE